MVAKVVDSWAMLAFFEGEPAALAVEELLHRAVLEKHKLYLSVINWGEIYYSSLRKISQADVEARSRDIASLPIQIVGVGEDLKLARQAASYKAAYRTHMPTRSLCLG
jgi:PIN domain nuclease of toxin-antitoxin system